MQLEQTVIDGKGRVISQPVANLIPGEARAWRVDRSKRPKIAVVLGGIVYVGGVVPDARWTDRIGSPGCVLFHDCVDEISGESLLRN